MKPGRTEAAGQSTPHPTIVLVGAGNLASTLGKALRAADYEIPEIVVRDRAASIAHARTLARRLGAKLATLGSEVSADVVWLCVRDDSIGDVAEALAAGNLRAKIAFHSSGALGSEALAPLKRNGLRVASVHPLMTFVPNSSPSLVGVWFGIEGERAAVSLARRIVQDIGGHFLPIGAQSKALYHAWGSFASPMLIVLLAIAERISRQAGIPAQASHQAILPLIQQTVANYAAHGASGAFSGPLRRGDAKTIERHLKALRSVPDAREIYLALARCALDVLPVQNHRKLNSLLED